MKNTRSNHSRDTRFNVENPSIVKRKNHGRQSANTPHYYQELGYNAVCGSLQDRILNGTLIWVYVPYLKSVFIIYN